jgi:hypothetical protein
MLITVPYALTACDRTVEAWARIRAGMRKSSARVVAAATSTTWATHRGGGTSVRRQVSRGGQAHEAGSLHRSGVAAYLAAHGLAGRG